VELLRSSSRLSTTITVSGQVYDVDTGVVTTILSAAAMRTLGLDSVGTEGRDHIVRAP
jgi:hypothetical protein